MTKGVFLYPELNMNIYLKLIYMKKKIKAFPGYHRLVHATEFHSVRLADMLKIKLVDVEPRKKSHGIVLVTMTQRGAIYCKSPVRLERRYLEIAEWRYINIMG